MTQFLIAAIQRMIFVSEEMSFARIIRRVSRRGTVAEVPVETLSRIRVTGNDVYNIYALATHEFTYEFNSRQNHKFNRICTTYLLVSRTAVSRRIDTLKTPYDLFAIACR